MKNLTSIVMVVTLCIGIPSAWAEETASSDEVFAEITAELGFVPEFFYLIPERILPEQWNLFKDAFLREDGPLSFKQKELIGLAVAGIVKCQYCIPMHHALARYHGATEEEINEAAQVARTVGQWSTFLYANNYPPEQFEKELKQIINHLP